MGFHSSRLGPRLGPWASVALAEPEPLDERPQRVGTERDGDAARTATSHSRSPAFSRRGRVVFPELTGIASYGLWGAPSLSGGVGVSGLLSFGLSTVGGRSLSSLAFRPAADLFITEHWTVGLTADVARSTSITQSSDRPGYGETTQYSLSAAPRIGRTFDLGPVTLWPKLAAGYGVARTESRGVMGFPGATGRDLSRTIMTELSFDVVLPLSAHVLFSVGPSVAYTHGDMKSNREIGESGDFDAVSMGVRGHLGVTLP